jgi:phosphocarrier protein
MHKDFVISHEQGLHARPATLLVAKANEFTNAVELTFEDTTIDLKSIMGLLSLGIPKGSLVRITVKGDDAGKVIEALTNVIAEINADS